MGSSMFKKNQLLTQVFYFFFLNTPSCYENIIQNKKITYSFVAMSQIGLTVVLI